MRPTDSSAGLPDSLRRAPRGRERRILLLACLDEIQHLLFLDTFSPGLLAVEAAVRARCPDVETRVVMWRRSGPPGDQADLVPLLDEYRPAVVGLSAHSSHMPLALAVAARIRAHIPEVPIVLGGRHATSFPDGIGRYAQFDYFVRGPGTRVGPRLFSALLDGTPDPAAIPSLALRAGGQVVMTPPETPPDSLDDDPPIDWASVDPGLADDREWVLYNQALTPFRFAFQIPKPFPYETSQGCNRACGFCERVGRTKIRNRSPERVAQDLVSIRDRFSIRRFFLADDNIYTDRSRFVDLLRRLARLDLRYWVEVKVDEIDVDLVDRMADSGVDMMYCSPESGSERIRALMGKRIDMPRLLATTERAAARGIFILSTFVFGWPSETLDEAQATVDLATTGPFDLRYFLPLVLYGQAPVGRQHLQDVGIRPDTPEYFHHLAFPKEICLARYSREEYLHFVDDINIDLNRRTLSSPEVQAKLERLGIRGMPPSETGAAAAPAAVSSAPSGPSAIEVRAPLPETRPTIPMPRFDIEKRNVFVVAEGLAAAVRAFLAPLRAPRLGVSIGPMGMEQGAVAVAVELRGHKGTLLFSSRRPGQRVFCSTRDLDVAYRAPTDGPDSSGKVLSGLATLCARRRMDDEKTGCAVPFPTGPAWTSIRETCISRRRFWTGPTVGLDDELPARLDALRDGSAPRRGVAVLGCASDLAWACDLPRVVANCEFVASWQGDGWPEPDMAACLAAAGFQRIRIAAQRALAPDDTAVPGFDAMPLPVQLRFETVPQSVQLDALQKVAATPRAASLSLLVEPACADEETLSSALAAGFVDRQLLGLQWETAGRTPAEILVRIARHG